MINKYLDLLLELGHEGLRGLVVDRGEGGHVADQLIEERRVERRRVLGNERLLAQHHLL